MSDDRLELVWNQALDAPDAFEQRAVLWIGSESYDAPAICVLEGLGRLGWTVYTINRSNVNSWFCETIISDPAEVEFDFVLSSLHWGTRWRYYKRYKLGGYPKILIDGDDTLAAGQTWRDKHAQWTERYGTQVARETLDGLYTARWMEPLGDYEPDMVFTWQKQFGDEDTHFLPAGMHTRYTGLGHPNMPLADRQLHFVHVTGPGIWRTTMRDLLAIEVLPGNVHNGPARGSPIYPSGIEDRIRADDNVHSYHRWTCWDDYYNTLNSGKVVVYPGIDAWPFWDSARPYEAWACGCLVAMSQPTIDTDDYPLYGVCPEAVYGNLRQLVEIANTWYASPGYLDKLRLKSVRRAYKYFTPKAVARYFLHKIRGIL